MSGLVGNEQVAPGDRGTKRWRRDPRVRQWLLAKRPLPDDAERIVSYRTEAAVAYRTAAAEGADPEVLALLLEEYGWALSRLGVLAPAVWARWSPGPSSVPASQPSSGERSDA